MWGLAQSATKRNARAGDTGAGVSFFAVLEEAYLTFTKTTAKVNRASVSINTKPRIIAV
jgi:hypothetical protein